MARAGGPAFSYVFAGVLLATSLLPDFLGAGPVGQRLKGDDGETKLVRHKRNISWYKQHSDFWNWYKYFTDTGNTKGVEELDRVYLTYLQNKNRAEGRRSYKLYLRHLGDIYKSCAESDDPNCVASYTSRPKPKPKPEPPKPAPIKPPPPAPAKAPAPVRVPVYPVKAPASGYYYYAPLQQSFLTAQQRSELLRICDAKDVECLQYHLRAAYGYKPSAGPAPSYAHLGCDPKKDPACRPQLVQKGPSGLYSPYLPCDLASDPYCLLRAAQAQAAQNLEAAGGEKPCNPLLDDNCNPLTATRLADLSRYVQPKAQEQEQAPRDEPAPASGAPCDPRYDPYCQYRAAAAAAMMRRPQAPPQAPPQEPPLRHPRLGLRGKTKEGYDCYMGYDEECTPLPANRPSAGRATGGYGYGYGYGIRQEEAYEPHLNPDGTRNGVVEPDPDCDPEYDANCRLRRYEPQAEPDPRPAAPAAEDQTQEHQPTEEHRDQPDRHEDSHHQGEPYHEELHQQEDPYRQAPGYEQQPEAPGMTHSTMSPTRADRRTPTPTSAPRTSPARGSRT
ncbi:hypothetical protein AGOR_G00142560 [Albula goreensis]|uniref:Actinodin1 n=1 Tax=Albula goreensis TaxID=1534307 RepID=A0A8T3D965_9TELE|nr:hypothetical protein AGOR_G00142560 [Albula goreensis]